MKRIVFFTMTLIFMSLLVNAQSINPKRLTLLKSNLLARENPKVSKEGKNCSIILVDVVGIKDLKFDEAEGDVKYSQNEYTVYVPEGTKSLTYHYGNETGTILFGDYGPDEVQAKTTYRLMMDTKNRMRSAVFYIKPVHAQLTVAGKKVNIDSNGTGSVDLPIGKYNYSVQSNGYIKQDGVLNLTDNEIITVNDITLDEIKYDYHLECNHPEASLFIDDTPYGKISDVNNNVQLTGGKHKVRITLEGFNDYIGDLVVKGPSSTNVNLEQKKVKIIRHKDERTKSSINIRPHVDILLSDHTILDDMNTQIPKFSVEFHQYVGYIAFKEGISIGAAIGSDEFCRKIDNYVDIIKENAKSKDDNYKVAGVLDIPLQLGFTLPLSKYNTSNVAFLAGGYASGYYIGHASENTTSGESVSTYTLDYGIRANVTFYFHKFALSFEGGQSLSDKKLGTFVGLHVGWRIYVRKK